jgi:general secretion pathway protein G
VSKNRAFTLLELLVVIVIIGLLAAYRPKVFSQLGKSEVTVTKSQIDAFDKRWTHFAWTSVDIQRVKGG